MSRIDGLIAVIVVITLLVCLPGCMDRAEVRGQKSAQSFEDRSAKTEETADSVTQLPDGRRVYDKYRKVTDAKGVAATATGVGASGDFNSGLFAGFNPQAPNANVGPEGTATWSKRMGFDALANGSGAGWLMIAGIGCILASAVLYWFLRDLMLSGIVAGTGIILIAFALFNWLALLGFVVIVALLVYWAYKTGKLDWAFKTVVAGVEEAKTTDPDAAEKVTKKIAEVAGDDVNALKNVVNQAKP